jgi:osmotically-inducible protein OsmY
MVFISACVLMTACKASTSSETASGMTDATLENTIKTKLNSDQQIRAANLGVSADVDRNEATLSGTVNSQALRTRAVELTKSAHPGISVIDKIDVEPQEISRAEYTDADARTEREKARGSGESIGDSLDDAWIHMKIVAKLIGDADTPERKINVDVVNNVVTLRGTVDTQAQKADAERIASETDGVQRVNNRLNVAKGTAS